MQTREFLHTDLTHWELGPYHPALPGPVISRLKVDGEIIVHAEFESGFLHRGLERAFNLHPWSSSMVYADRLDPEAAIFGEMAVCLAVEELASISVPPRAQSIRLILSELTRISQHMAYIVKLARAVGADTITHYVLRERERILDLFELLTGARFSINFLRFGGVSVDVTEGFIERVLEVCDLIRVRLKEYNDLFSFNQAFLERAAFVGVIHREDVQKSGLTGPNARASGILFDVRRAHPYGGYQQLDFEIPVGQGEGGTLGDAHDRYLVRLREVSQSVEILKQLCESVPFGDFLNPQLSKKSEIPPGEAYSRVESPRGLLGCHVVSDGGASPARIQYRVPSQAALMLAPKVICGTKIEDLPVILASLDIGISEVDR